MKSLNIAVVGETLSGECICALRGFGYDVVVLPRDERLGAGVCTHTDLLVFPLDGRLYVYGGEARRLLRAKGLDTVEVGELPEAEYPRDVYLNALAVGKYIFARREFLASAIRTDAEALGYTVIDVRQGYARCTACPVSDKAIITADPSIARAAESVGIEVLRVSAGGVTLKGYSYGFIGGACGVTDDRVFFAGDIYTHPDGERIVEFCRGQGKEAVSLCGGALCDVGSIFFI